MNNGEILMTVWVHIYNICVTQLCLIQNDLTRDFDFTLLCRLSPCRVTNSINENGKLEKRRNPIYIALTPLTSTNNMNNRGPLS